MQIQNILRVCVRNISRSHMAEYFLKHRHVSLNIESAGISTMVNYRADEKAICLNQFSIYMQSHIAKQIQAEHLKNTNLALESILKKLGFLLRVKFSVLGIRKVKTFPPPINLIKIF